MDNNRLNLIYKLNRIVNENEIGSVEYELAKYFLENFSDMKAHAQEFDDSVLEFEQFYGYDKLVMNITSLMEELSIRFNTQEVNRLVKMINESQQVVIVCSSNIAGAVSTFQQRMIIFGKRITLILRKKNLRVVLSQKTDHCLFFFRFLDYSFRHSQMR
ncbi:hypothetical protein [Enterococcus durans]|uniref:hypothetical protein n=1 Tax=Enterococcus durans TaxID=53345 RepID=UPI0021C3FAC3|nr:hypothetical protein [Enterococcus durans]